MKTSTSRSVQDIVFFQRVTLFNGIIFAAMVLVLITGSWEGPGVRFSSSSSTRASASSHRTQGQAHAGQAFHPVASESCIVTAGTWSASTRSCSTTCRGSVPANRCRPTEQIIQTWGLGLTSPCSPANRVPCATRWGAGVLGAAVSAWHWSRSMRSAAIPTPPRCTAQAGIQETVSDLNKASSTILKFMTFLVVPLCILLDSFADSYGSAVGARYSPPANGGKPWFPRSPA